jgi:hypothetical protein
MVFSKEFYLQNIKPLHNNYQNGCFYIETQFYQAIKKLEDGKRVIFRFPIEPDFHGIAGHFGGKDYSSPKERAKFLIRSQTRKVLPWVHL